MQMLLPYGSAWCCAYPSTSVQCGAMGKLLLRAGSARRAELPKPLHQGVYPAPGEAETEEAALEQLLQEKLSTGKPRPEGAQGCSGLNPQALRKLVRGELKNTWLEGEPRCTLHPSPLPLPAVRASQPGLG